MVAGLKGAIPLCWHENPESRGKNQDFPGLGDLFGVRGEVRSGGIGRGHRRFAIPKFAEIIASVGGRLR